MNRNEPGPSTAGWLTQETYRQLEHTASLKGLLQPFKGKGELESLAQLARSLEAQLAELMTRLEHSARHAPYSLLNLRLARQSTGAGSTFLRWRSRDFSRMGVNVWADQMNNTAHSPSLRQALYHVEIDRIALNLQMSVTHSLYRQAVECAGKMALAEELLRQFPNPRSIQHEHSFHR
ncbi:hypothetical protein D3C78_281760 [compost metagenome]